MRTKAIADLAQLSEKQFLVTVASGLQQIAENALILIEDASRLELGKGRRGVPILTSVANEESGKFLILIDAVRCPREDSGRFVAQLRKFNDHLAKGIYAKSCYGMMGSFGAHRKWIEEERQEFYLDGPTGVDWIFKNEILQRREQNFYVDYVSTDNGNNWWSPYDAERFEGSELLPARLPPSLQLVRAMADAGFATPEALAVIARKWRNIEMADDLQHWQVQELNSDTLKTLEAEKLLLDHAQSGLSTITELWPFPLHSIDIGIVKVDQGALRQVQDSWYPDQ